VLAIRRHRYAVHISGVTLQYEEHDSEIQVMAAAVYAIGLAIPAAWPLWLRVAAKVSVGVVTYGLALWRIYPPERIALWKELIMGMRADSTVKKT
jgi:hypothetical protein